jgi:hypothetical protein
MAPLCDGGMSNRGRHFIGWGGSSIEDACDLNGFQRLQKMPDIAAV